MNKKKRFTFAEDTAHIAALKREQKAAFTLAEVLITLGIIGVVAALTMPAVIANYKKKETVTRLKKAYSVVEQAIKMSEVENGEIQFWQTNMNGPEFLEKYLKQYIQYTEEYSSKELWALAPRKMLSDQPYTGTTYAQSSAATHIMLPDGVLVTFNLGSANAIWVGIDTNGLTKPNQIGKDTFLFVFTSQYGLQPLGGKGTDSGWSYGEYDRDKIIGSTNPNACTKKSTGYWCAALIMNDGWEIAGDYPW